MVGITPSWSPEGAAFPFPPEGLSFIWNSPAFQIERREYPDFTNACPPQQPANLLRTVFFPLLPGEKDQTHVIAGAVGKGALQIVPERLADDLLFPVPQPGG